MSYVKAITAINKAGLLLVFPLKNERDPASLWYALYPRSPMRWDWSENADERVVKLWHLKVEISEERDVVYAKWFRGRATFFSRPLFMALLRVVGAIDCKVDALDRDAKTLYQLLSDDSPQTSRMLRAAAGLEGKPSEAMFNRGMRALWERFLIAGSGEIDDGAFPSLAVGTTKNFFEDLWDEAAALSLDEARVIVDHFLPPASLWGKFLARTMKKNGVPAPR